VGLLLVPRAAVRRAKALGDARDRRERGEIGVRLARRQEGEPGRERLRCRARAVVLRDQRTVGLGVEDEDDRPQCVEGVPVERARTDDVDAAGKARDKPFEERAEIRRRARGLGPAS
jgi:hypothetical protein